MKLRAQWILALGLLAVPFLPATGPLRASDHADTAQNATRPGADLTDVFIFPSPTNDNNVVLVMNVHPLIPAGQGGNVSFDPNVLYQFKMDVTGDFVEDLVIQVRFMGTGAGQRAVVVGPSRPYTTGTTAVLGRPYPTTGAINTTFSPTPGMTVFAGARSDPFFFDLNRFYAILPDRMTPLTGGQVDFASIMAADNPQVNGFRGFLANNFGGDTSPAMDFLANFNLLSIVIELPRASLGGGVIRLWETTNVAAGAPNFNFVQQDRLARPAVNEVLATVTARRHEVNNKANPTDDPAQLKTDIQAFMAFPAARSTAITNALTAVLVPDVMIADLSQMGVKAAFLGVETQGLSGSKFGGRDLKDDIVDIDLMAVFGGLIPFLSRANPNLFGGVIADDGQEKKLAQFATDNVGPHNDFLPTFPYLGNPH